MRNLPPEDAALWRAVDPDSWWRLDHELVATVIDRLGALVNLTGGLLQSWGTEQRDVARAIEATPQHPRPGRHPVVATPAAEPLTIHDWIAGLALI